MSAFGAPLGRCSARMTYGNRKRSYRGHGSYTSGTPTHRPCPNDATRTLDGQPYCDAHSPTPTLKREHGRWLEKIGGRWVPQQTYLRERDTA